MADSNQKDDSYNSSSSSGMCFSNLSMRTILSDESIQSYLFRGSRSLGQHSYQDGDDDDDGDGDNENVQMQACGETPNQPSSRRSSICKEQSLDLLAVFASARFCGKSDQDVYESAQRNGFTDERIYACSRMLNTDHNETSLQPQEVFINLINDVSRLMNESILSDGGNASSMHMSREICSVSRASFVNHVALAREKFMEKLELSRAYTSKDSIPEENLPSSMEVDEISIEGDENRPPSPAGGAEVIVETNPNDVLPQRQQNGRIRELVEARYDEYMRAEKLEKTAIAASIVQQIQREGGRFLQEKKRKVGKKRSLDGGQKQWVEMSFKKAREKVSSTFRNITKEAGRAEAKLRELVEARYDEVDEISIEGDENRPPSPAGGAEVIVETNPNDVLGQQNRRLLELVKPRYDEYLRAKKLEKIAIAASIVQQIQREGGRFLGKSDGGQKQWVEMSFEKARGKVSSTFRNITKAAGRAAAKSEAMEE